MTREEYEKLVKSCESFNNMEAVMQTEILEAEGESMEYYIKMFQKERDTVAEADQEFKQEVERIVIDHHTRKNKKQRETLLVAEKESSRGEEKQIEDLLNNI